MTCGISGAGKSTFSKSIVAQLPNFTRLSIDAIIHAEHGLYAIDYPADKYADYQVEARQRLETTLISLLQEGQRDIVLDLAFWNREYRNEFKKIVESNGGRWLLVFLDAEKEVLWRRIQERRARREALSVEDGRRDGDSAFNVDEGIFEVYCEGFERPVGEGEVVIKVV
ncbi:hypothetical protein PT974_05090 [Cladobotryum mycophilum]|uniref:ATP/GTP-binding protein n=1 Tax=Cladobotryum mycophilum TaxID=491253 RepID=A0ABR0SSA7_9HYPO